MEAFAEQYKQVIDIMKVEKNFHEEGIAEFSNWFYTQLGLPAQYFSSFQASEIAKHIKCLKVPLRNSSSHHQAAKILAETSGTPFNIQLREEEKVERSLLVSHSRTAPYSLPDLSSQPVANLAGLLASPRTTLSPPS